MNKKLKEILPEHLRNIEISRDQPPATRDASRLPYDELPPGEFELFCCDLLSREFSAEDSSGEILTIEPLAGDGQSQFGADIFCQRRHNGHLSNELFEVKRVRKFNVRNFREAVERFVENRNRWGFQVKRFTMITSERVPSEVISSWKSGELQKILGDVEIDIWSGWSLDKCIERHPSLVFKYFHPVWTERLFGTQAREHYEKYGIYEFRDAASWENYDKPYEIEMGDTFIVQNDHVKIYAFLPSKKSGSASCSVELRNGRFSHVVITLSDRKLVNTYFQGYAAPPSSGERIFLTEMFDKKDYWICDLGNCRIIVSQEEADCLCSAFDSFYRAYERRLLDREALWKCRDFSLQEGLGEAIPLIEITRGMWNLLREFAKEHDAFETQGEWSMFDAGGHGLKVFTDKTDDEYQAGYHVFINPRRVDRWLQDFSRADDKVLLIWEPPTKFGISEFGEQIGRRHYWDAQTTFDWLTNELIPYALYWNRQRQSQNERASLLRKLKRHDRDFETFKKEFSKSRESFVYIYSYRREDRLDINGVSSREEMLSIAYEIQRTFHGRHKGVFLTEIEYRDLYGALAVVLKHAKPKYFGYLHGNLNYLHADDLPSLVDAVLEHARTEVGDCTNSFKLDCAMRSFISAIEDAVTPIAADEIELVKMKLHSVWKIIERIKILDRQKERLGPER